MKSLNRRIFLDHASITPLDSEVKKEMDHAQKIYWANPSSLHQEGEQAKNALENARIKIAHFLHCRASEIFFTSGGTEALNLAILGVVKESQKASFGTGAVQRRPLAFLPHVIVSTIEHPAVLEPIKNLIKEKKVEVSFVVPDKNGIINPESVKKEIKENTVLVAIQHANNEIGTIQPIREISKIIHKFKSHNTYPIIHTPYFLVDACQSALYEDVSIERLGADLLVLDGIKMYGPRGAGILVVKRDAKISPVIFGGGQEGGLRSGTENVANAIGLAKALEIAYQKREKESTRLTKLHDYAIEKILKEIPNSSLNGEKERRLPNNINICFAENQNRTFGTGAFQSPTLVLDSEFLVIKLDTLGFAVSAASACHSLSLENSSYVIESVSGKNCSASSLRITLGRDTQKSDLDKLISALKKILLNK